MQTNDLREHSCESVFFYMASLQNFLFQYNSIVNKEIIGGIEMEKTKTKTKKEWLRETLHMMEPYLLNSTDHIGFMNPFYMFDYTDEQKAKADYNYDMLYKCVNHYTSVSGYGDELFNDVKLIMKVLKEEKLEHIAVSLSSYIPDSDWLEELF